jgi:diguanylate cyclase (GGDEF)-like protein
MRLIKSFEIQAFPMVSVDIHTLFLGSSAVLAVFAIIFVRHWREEPGRLDFVFWGGATVAGAIGSLLTLVDGSYVFGSAFAESYLLLAGALAWQGLRIFDHRRPDLRLAISGPAIFFLFTASAPIFEQDPAVRFIVLSWLGALYSGLIAREHLLSEREENLANRRVVRLWFSFQTGVLLLAGLAALVVPLPQAGSGNGLPFWVAPVALAIFLQSIAAPVSFLLLLRDRLLVETRWASATDSLTGLANRFTFLDMLQTLSTKVRGEGAFLYVDVDHVKRINDRFGHSGGDEVLKTCAELILRELPEHALLGRLAGAEFAAYVPFCKVEEAEKLGHVIHDSVEQQMFFLGGELVPVTVSVGVAHGALQVTADELLKRADAALHTAKVNGRNSVVVWTDGQRPSFA